MAPATFRIPKCSSRSCFHHLRKLIRHEGRHLVVWCDVRCLTQPSWGHIYTRHHNLTQPSWSHRRRDHSLTQPSWGHRGTTVWPNPVEVIHSDAEAPLGVDGEWWHSGMSPRGFFWRSCDRSRGCWSSAAWMILWRHRHTASWPNPVEATEASAMYYQVIEVSIGSLILVRFIPVPRRRHLASFRRVFLGCFTFRHLE